MYTITPIRIPDYTHHFDCSYRFDSSKAKPYPLLSDAPGWYTAIYYKWDTIDIAKDLYKRALDLEKDYDYTLFDEELDESLLELLKEEYIDLNRTHEVIEREFERIRCYLPFETRDEFFRLMERNTNKRDRLSAKIQN